MKLLRSFRILIFIAVFIGMIAFDHTPMIRADEPLTFQGELEVFMSMIRPAYEDSNRYIVYADTGDIVSITFKYSVSCYYANSQLGVFIGTQEVDTLEFDWSSIPQSSPPQPINFNGAETYTHVITTSESIQIGLVLTSSLSILPPSACKLNYQLIISGATLTPPPSTIPVDPIIAAEEAAGLQRVQDNALPVVIYTPTANNPDRFIDIRDLEGNPLLYISADDLAALPEFLTENRLIASTSDGFISVYKLTTGEYQVNVGPLPDGKVHVIIFHAIPRTHTYGYTLDVTNPAP